MLISQISHVIWRTDFSGFWWKIFILFVKFFLFMICSFTTMDVLLDVSDTLVRFWLCFLYVIFACCGHFASLLVSAGKFHAHLISLDTLQGVRLS